MKIKFLLAFVMTFVFEGMYSHEISRKVFEDESSKLGGDVKIMSSSEYVDGNNIKVSFDIMCETEGYYNASFWLLPAMSPDGSFVKYQLEVNGHKQTVEIVPATEDWQNYVLSDKEKIFLSKGMNTVSVIGVFPDIPSVEHIKLSKDRWKVIEESDGYTEYKLCVG